MVTIQARCSDISGGNQGLIANAGWFYQANLAEIWPKITKTVGLMRKLITILKLFGNLKVLFDSNLLNRQFSNNIINRISISTFILGKGCPLHQDK